ncbi:MAG TPA: FtsX-like permease family protein, partial [Treponemataceae bacterium]|nr:FtsX-like permease family protein [Treponemataceae bacterium]
VLGSALARSLGVHPGDTINLLAMSGGSGVDLFAENRNVRVSGIFSCSFSEINKSFAFLRLDDSAQLLGESEKPVYGIKIFDPDNAAHYIAQMQTKFNKTKILNSDFESWQKYNRSFFGALRIEKNMLMMLVFLIFIVVAVNIFNSMRRIVYERREEISVLSALGASKKNIQRIFLVQGFRIGLGGAVPGLLLGLLLSVRMDKVFELIADISYYVQYFFTMLVNPLNSSWVSENSMLRYYAKIPAQARFAETALITLFGVLAAVIASWFASRHILKLSVAEVLRDE